MPIDVKIGGRLFTPATLSRRTVEMDHYLQRIVAESGIDKVLPLPEDSDDSYIFRLHAALIASGRACDLLGVYLLPVGDTERDWSPTVACHTSNHLRKCDTEEDREEVDAQAMECALGFFQQRMRSLQRFQASFASMPAH